MVNKWSASRGNIFKSQTNTWKYNRFNISLKAKKRKYKQEKAASVKERKSEIINNRNVHLYKSIEPILCCIPSQTLVFSM